MSNIQEKKNTLKNEALIHVLKNIISEVAGVAPAAIKITTDLQKHLGIDSFNATEILVAIEKEYGITIDKADAFGVRTFQDVLRLAKKYISER